MAKKLKKKNPGIRFPKGLPFVEYGYQGTPEEALRRFLGGRFREKKIKPMPFSNSVDQFTFFYVPSDRKATEAFKVAGVMNKWVKMWYYNDVLGQFVVVKMPYFENYPAVLRELVNEAAFRDAIKVTNEDLKEFLEKENEDAGSEPGSSDPV